MGLLNLDLVPEGQWADLDRLAKAVDEIWIPEGETTMSLLIGGEQRLEEGDFANKTVAYVDMQRKLQADIDSDPKFHLLHKLIDLQYERLGIKDRLDLSDYIVKRIEEELAKYGVLGVKDRRIAAAPEDLKLIAWEIKKIEDQGGNIYSLLHSNLYEHMQAELYLMNTYQTGPDAYERSSDALCFMGEVLDEIRGKDEPLFILARIEEMVGDLQAGDLDWARFEGLRDEVEKLFDHVDDYDDTSNEIYQQVCM